MNPLVRIFTEYPPVRRKAGDGSPQKAVRYRGTEGARFPGKRGEKSPGCGAAGASIFWKLLQDAGRGFLGELLAVEIVVIAMAAQ